MNYIHRLQSEVAELEAELAAEKERINSLVRYLTSAKFAGVDYRDGSSNSRVEVADVLHRLGRM